MAGQWIEIAAADGGNGRLKAERAALADAAAQVEGIATAMTGYLMASAEQPAEIYKAGLNTTRLLMALGDLVIGWLLLTHAEVALRELDQLDAEVPTLHRVGPAEREAQLADRRRAYLRRLPEGTI